MKNTDFTTSITVQQTPEKVFNAINNVRSWWSQNIEGATNQAGSIFIYRDKYLEAKMQIRTLTKTQIIWDVLETHNSFFGKENEREWDGTSIQFDINQNKTGTTTVKFTHKGLTTGAVCYNVCSNSWEYFIGTSLKALIETGKGKDISNDENSFSLSLQLAKPISEVYAAILNVRGWWSKAIEGLTDELGSEFTYYYQDKHAARFQILTLQPDQKIVWFVKENYFDFAPDELEWQGTKIVFELQSIDKQNTSLLFTHHGLIESQKCYSACSAGWRQYILGSLNDLILKGKGSPNPMESKDQSAAYLHLSH